jgi:hypothetical protein
MKLWKLLISRPHTILANDRHQVRPVTVRTETNQISSEAIRALDAMANTLRHGHISIKLDLLTIQSWTWADLAPKEKGQGFFSPPSLNVVRVLTSQVHTALAGAVMALFVLIVRRAFDPNQREQDCRIIRAGPSAFRQ